MRNQLQLALDHTPSFKAGSELVYFPSRLGRSSEVLLRGSVVDGKRLIPVVFRTTRDRTVSTVFLSCFTRVVRYGAPSLGPVPLG